ncbi:AsmA family protein [Undibacterium sp. Ji22W]|uniref:AsmA family protein n=1 Tax=Undibacterium sp. Ji22W TaxID=3413038 RepID=UPI003BF0AB12
MKIQIKTKVLLSVFAVLIALPMIAIVFMSTFDWNRLKPKVNAVMTEALGRPFQIQGELRLQWVKADLNSTLNKNLPDLNWLRWIPWPRFTATDIHIDDPVSFQRPQIDLVGASNQTERNGGSTNSPPIVTGFQKETASIQEVSFSLSPWSLLHKEISIPVLSLNAPEIHLLRNANGANNWALNKSGGASLWRLDLQQIALSEGIVYLRDAIKHIDVKIILKEDRNDPDYYFAWKLNGELNAESLIGEGHAGAVLAMNDPSRPFPIQGYLRQDQTTIALRGSLTRPTDLMAVHMRLAVSALSMAKLYGLSGIFLPETPPFSTEGELSGDLEKDGGKWTYHDFRGKVGASDIAGDLQFDLKSPRPLLSGAITSKLLVFSDLAPIIGLDSRSSKQTRGLAIVQPSNKILPIETFKTDRWKSIDADVKFSADHIIHSAVTSISKLTTHLRLQSGVLSLTPLNFDLAGGSLSSDIRLDGSQEREKNAILANIQVRARHLQLKKVMPFVKDLDASLGEINAEASLTAEGNSIASLLGASHGELSAYIHQGTISKLLLEKIGLNIGSIVLTSLLGDEDVKLNCLDARFTVHQGVMKIVKMIVDTQQSRLTLQGNVNLQQEKINVEMTQKSKGVRLISLRAPIYIRGTLQHPTTEIDKGVVALRAGAAIALAALAPIAALIPLVNSGSKESVICGKVQTGKSPHPK